MSSSKDIDEELNRIDDVDKDFEKKLKCINDIIEISDLDNISEKKVKTKDKLLKKEELLNIIDDQMDEMDKLIMDLDSNNHLHTSIIRKKRTINKNIKKVHYCNICKLVFKTEDIFNEHLLTHNNPDEDYCICHRCLKFFNNDFEYYNHNCEEASTSENENIPENENGEYACPNCEKKYSNIFLLGEHFIRKHNDYNTLCDLDSNEKYGYPGKFLLKKIGMIKMYTKKNCEECKNKECKICFYKYDLEYYKKKQKDQERYPIKLLCCNKKICWNCLKNYLRITDSLNCPFCKKDHTRNDWDFVKFIEEIDITKREDWIPWWDDHLDIL